METEQFIIEDKKIVDYLLNENHPKGKFKAKWLLNKGFNPTNLRSSLETHGKNSTVVKSETTPFGIFEIREGPLELNDVPPENFRTVWEVIQNNNMRRFVTGYPI